MADERPPATGSVRPTVLVVGDDEPMDEAICAALDRNGLDVERVPTLEAVDATRLAAPDLVLLVGDAARAAGEVVLARLAQNPLTQLVPVALLSDDAALGERLAAFRHGAVAVVPRTASVDEMARKVADIAREMPERQGEQTGELGEATFDELMKLVKQELRSGILSVEAGGDGRTEGSTAFRLVLGAGKPVAKAVEAFVAQLRPLVSKAEPLRYELLEHAGARFGLLDSETGGATEGEADLAALRGLRVLLVVLDPVRADALASELRSRGATVAVADASGRGLERARGLDPEVVIIDAAGIEGPGFAVVKACRRDPRLRWASMLVAQWEELWPEGAGSPDMPRLASRLAPLIEPDRTIGERAIKETSFDTRLELIGPSRMLRALARVEPTLHITVRNPRCVVDVDLSQGLVVGAVAKREGQPAGTPLLEGHAALAALLALGSGRVRIERRTNPQSANVMAPIEEALAIAAGEEPPLPASVPPPSLVGGLGLGGADSGPPPASPASATAAAAQASPAETAEAQPVTAPSAVPFPRALSNAFDEAPTSTHTPVGPTAKRTLVGLPSPASRATPASKTSPPKPLPRPKTMLGLAPALVPPTPAAASALAPLSAASNTAAAPAAAGSVPGFVPASAPPLADSEPPEPELALPLPLPGRLPREAAAVAAASPGPTLAPSSRIGPAQKPGNATVMGMPAVMPSPAPLQPAALQPAALQPAPLQPAPSHLASSLATTHLAASQPSTFAPTMTSTMPGPPTASIPPPEPLANIVLVGEPLDQAPAVPLDSFVIPDASVIPGALPARATPARQPRRSIVPLVVFGGIGLLLVGVGITAAALVLPSLLAGTPPDAMQPHESPIVPTRPVLPTIALRDAGALAAPPLVVVPTVLPFALTDAGVALTDGGAAVIDGGAVLAPVVVPIAEPDAGVETPAVADVAYVPLVGEGAEETEPRPDSEVSSGDRLVVRANRILAAGDMRQAEVVYLEALEAEPRNPHALAGLARLHLARRAGRQALAYAERAVAVRPRRSAYRVVMGDALTQLGRRAEAQRAYREALRIDPRSREARARLPAGR